MIMAIETDNAKDHELTEKMYNEIGDLFESLKKEYKNVSDWINKKEKIMLGLSKLFFLALLCKKQCL